MTPLLITLTAPSASGKTYLFEKLLKLGFDHLVSTTTRQMRPGEVEGKDYFYITKAKSAALEKSKAFAELIEFNGVRYGITNDEMDKKFSGDKPIVAILTPEGVDIYKHLVTEHNGKLISVFIDAPEKVRIERLNKRLLSNLNDSAHTEFGKINNTEFSKIIAAHTDRIMKVVTEEREWNKAIKYDITVNGEDASDAVSKIQTFIDNIK